MFLEITKRCLHEEPKNRPTMSQVVLQLELALEQQDINQKLRLNEVAKRTQLSSTLQPTVDSINMQHLTLPPNQQTNNKVDNADVLSGRKHSAKSIKFKPTGFLSWEAFWNRVKPSKNYGPLLSEEESFAAVLKLPKFDWDQIAAATNHFSPSKIVGYGRFGTFYKAVLPSGELVAVKRGSSSSAYAQKLVKMESIVLSNLQHPNIVKLLGYCMEGETIWLLYEFMENRSLDYIIDVGQQQHLQWAVRFQIIIGIARGLAYLHHDSGLSVIHGDLKLANILLDINMNPKISGLYFSRRAVEYQSELEISLVQEIGYMFPEYLLQMKSTVKTDVCSLGIILLEIVSGRRRYSHRVSKSLVEHAWYLWNEGRSLALVDDSLGSAFEEDEAIRCIQVALLCIQDCPDQRPLMSSVVKMLEGNEGLLWPQLPEEVSAGISENTNADGLDSNSTFEPR
ncbi:hypothetical protein ACS0TY_028497 [Phlomoides rotata]